MNSISPLSPPSPSPQAARTAPAGRTGFRKCPMWVKVGLGLNVGGVALTWVSVLSPYWLVNQQLDIVVGPLFGCQRGDCRSAEALTWQVALASLEICALLGTVPSLALALSSIFISGKKWVKIAAAITAFATALFILTGVIVCAAKKDDFPEVLPGFRPTFDLSWAFALAVVAGVHYCGSAVCFQLDIWA